MPENKKPDWVIKDRVRFFKAADEIVRLINDENAFVEWASEGIPDGASDDELKEIAEDDGSSNDISALFVSLIRAYGKGHSAFCGALDGKIKKAD